MNINTSKHRDFLVNFAYYSLLIVLTFLFLRYAFRYCWPVIVGWLIAALAVYINKKINKKQKLSKVWLTIILILIYVVLVGLATLIGMLALKFIMNFNYIGFFETRIAPALDNVKNIFIHLTDGLNIEIGDSWNQLVTNVMGEVSTLLKTIITRIGSFVSKTPTMIIEVIMLIIVSIYLLFDYDNTMNGLKKILPKRILSICEHSKEFAIGILFKCIKAYALIMFITFVEVLISLNILGFENTVVISLATSICDILPVLGVGTVFIPWGIISILLGKIGKGIGMLIAYLIITLIRNYIEPKLVGNQINLHPLVSLVAIFLGTQIMGLSGALLVPLLVALLKYLYKKGDFFQQ